RGGRLIPRPLRRGALSPAVRGGQKPPAAGARPAFNRPAGPACASSERRLGVAAVFRDVGLEPFRRSIEHSRSADYAPPPRAPPAPIRGGRARSPNRS